MKKTIPTPLSSYAVWHKFAQQVRRDYLLRNQNTTEKIPKIASSTRDATTGSRQTRQRPF